MNRLHLTLSTTASLLAAGFLLAPQEAHAQFNLNATPSRLIGQLRNAAGLAAPNQVDGRGLWAPQGVALDASAGTLYVADSLNHRILAWRNAAGAESGKAADLVIGQRDFNTSLAQGPGTSQSSGLNLPTALLVDRAGNLYVADSGNNRVLRFPRPFDQPSDAIAPDMVFGQANLNSRLANRGQQLPSAESLALTSGGSVLIAGLALDTAGNLWIADAGNHRVLRYPASVLASPRNGPPADLVIGQFDFITNTNANQNIPAGQSNVIRKDALLNPAGIAFDQRGRLFVCDNLRRVLVYDFQSRPPLNGQFAERIMGIVVQQQGQPAQPPVNPITFGNPQSPSAPAGVFFVGPNPHIIDTGNHRILRFDAFELWPQESVQYSPSAREVLGQADFNSGQSNRGSVPAADTLSSPVAAALSPTADLFVVDAANHRVLKYTGRSSFYTQADNVFGQSAMNLNSPNLIEGKEFYFADTRLYGGGLALDGNILYVADPGNNRVLAWRDMRSAKPGQVADLVIGQPDFTRAVINWPNNDANSSNDRGLNFPTAVAVDPEGNLWVADTGNGRVLRFPRPFDQPSGQLPRANLVLGQLNFTTRSADANSRTTGAPAGIALGPNAESVIIADSGFNRVMLWKKSAGVDFTNGQQATSVFGQPDFFTVAAGNLPNRMRTPRGVFMDIDQRLYVCDTGNSRLVIFTNALDAGTDPSPAFATSAGLNQPYGVYVNPRTGEIWVADTFSNRAVRLPRFELLVINPVAEAQVPAGAPVALLQDSLGNLIIADSLNRVVFHYPGVAAVNAANFSTRPLAPGTYTALFSTAGGSFRFNESTVAFSTVPMPTSLGDIQVNFNGTPVPVQFVSPTQINFIVPLTAPTSGTVDITVVRESSGEVISAGVVQMSIVSPGLFTANSTGNGQLAAVNQDGAVNGPSTAIPRGQVIQLFGTGQGRVTGAPPDGSVAQGQTATEIRPRVVLGTTFVDDSAILYSGFAPGLIGVWQVNVRVPENTAPGVSTPLSVVMRDIPNNVLPQRTTIAVR